MTSPSFEQHVRERIRHFDMPSLLALLAREGYGEGDIEYRSHRTLVHQGHLVHDIQFLHEPRRRIILTVNLGLLGVQSPLPAFLLREMDQMDPLETERMERFLGFFDHGLLRARFASLYPEQDASLLPGWAAAAESRLSLMSLTSPSTLHWLFAQLYPEAEVHVRREVRAQEVATHGTQMGATLLGDSTALGGFASVPTGGVEVVLFFNDIHCGLGTPWALEATRRLSQRVAPLLARPTLPLTVWMVIRERSAPAHLQHDSYLGYTPLIAGDAVQRTLLFQNEHSLVT